MAKIQDEKSIVPAVEVTICILNRVVWAFILILQETGIPLLRCIAEELKSRGSIVTKIKLKISTIIRCETSLEMESLKMCKESLI